MVRTRVACALAVLLPLAAACVDDATRLERHRQRGDAYFTEGKLAEALIEYKNVLQIDPNDAAAHHGLAKAHLARRELRKAYWELQEAVRLDPALLEARLALAQFLLLGREAELEQALVQAQALLEQAPELVEAHLVRAQALEALGRPEPARESLEQAIGLAPRASTPRLLLAELHRRQGERSAAEVVLRALVEAAPDFEVHSALAGLLAEAPERAQDAERHYREALALADPEQAPRGTQQLAGFLAARGRLDEAEQVLRDATRAAPERLELVYALARLHDARGDAERADAVLEQAARAHPDQVAPRLVLSVYRDGRGDAAGALRAAEEALEIDAAHLGARLRRAELLVEAGVRDDDPERIAEAERSIDAILAQTPSEPGALVVRAKAQLAASQPGPAAATLRQVLERRPHWPQIRFLLGSALLASGDLPGARSELLRALEQDPELGDARRLLVQVYAARGEDALAFEHGTRVLEQRPYDAQVRILVAQSLVRGGRIEEGVQTLLAVPAAARDADLLLALARSELLRDRAPAARAHLESALARQPDHQDVLATLLELDAQEGRAQDGLARIDAALRDDPERVALLRLRAAAQRLTGQPDEAERSLWRAIELDPRDLASYEQLGRLLARSGRRDEMLAAYERALAARPEQAELHLVVGMLHEQRARPEQAIRSYEAALRLDPALTPAQNNLAYLLAERGRELDRALELAQQARSRMPGDPNAADTLGWVLYKKKLPAAAIGHLREAEGAMPAGSPHLGIVRHHLALAYEADGQLDEARAVAERALAELERSPAAGDGTPEPAWAAGLRHLRERLAAAGA